MTPTEMCKSMPLACSCTAHDFKWMGKFPLPTENKGAAWTGMLGGGRSPSPLLEPPL